MILFGDKNTKQYVELEHGENYHVIIHWVDHPREIIYYSDPHDERMYNHVVQVYIELFKNCNDMINARKILDHHMFKEKIVRTVEQVRELKNHAFDSINATDESYWFGVFDALRWMLGDEVEGFKNV